MIWASVACLFVAFLISWRAVRTDMPLTLAAANLAIIASILFNPSAIGWVGVGICISNIFHLLGRWDNIRQDQLRAHIRAGKQAP